VIFDNRIATGVAWHHDALAARAPQGVNSVPLAPYSGSPILIEELLYKPEHSLIDQSLHARLGVETTNGDGFGVGWYGANSETPAVFHSIEPAWNDRNPCEVAGHVESGLFLAHIRASTGTAVQQTNCHPFRYGRWIWVHDGLVRDFHRLKRDLALAVDESLYASIEGSTDSELLFYLALTFGLQEDPEGAAGMTGRRRDRILRIAFRVEKTWARL
jgi:predicted glutamine amidotransferase